MRASGARRAPELCCARTSAGGSCPEDGGPSALLPAGLSSYNPARGSLMVPDDPWGAPVVVPVEDVLDLHAFVPRDIPSVVEAYVEAAAAAGFREVRLVHGRGIGVQRRRVRDVLARLSLVASFRDAPAERGGWGATVVQLRPGRSEPSARPPQEPSTTDEE